MPKKASPLLPSRMDSPILKGEVPSMDAAVVFEYP